MAEARDPNWPDWKVRAEPDWDSDPDYVIGMDGKRYRKVPLPTDSDETKARFVGWWRSRIT